MNYSSLEEVYGTPFGQRIPVTHERKDVKVDSPIQSGETLEDRSKKSIEKHADLVSSVTKSLPLDDNVETRSFDPKTPSPDIIPAAIKRNDRIREKFLMPMSGGGGDDDKLSRILRLIEQNKTGYEPASPQDMVLYIATGVFFLFVFDTFVMLGKTMRR
jgi:hypothetical protein